MGKGLIAVVLFSTCTFLTCAHAPLHPGFTFLITNAQGYKEYLNKKDRSTMVLIPAGEFSMGSNVFNNVSWEKPEHTVYLDAYYIDKYEVTVGQYKKFCKVTGRTMPRKPKWNQGDNYPVVRVSWEDASSYALWAAKRLPTEAEWEKAARGADGRIYPWGNEWDTSKCNSAHSRHNQTKPIGCYPQGASPYGVMDMAGNVLEWCQDWYDWNYYQKSPSRNPTGPSSGTFHVQRGGSWEDPPDGCCTSFRKFSSIGGQDIGFRCVRDAK